MLKNGEKRQRTAKKLGKKVNTVREKNGEKKHNKKIGLEWLRYFQRGKIHFFLTKTKK